MARATIPSPFAAAGGRRRALVACVVLLAALTAPAHPASARIADAVASARACTIAGTAAADRLVGTARADVICGRAGADSIRGGRGADNLRGGGGGDLLQGKSGADQLRGDSGNDALYGGAGRDRLRGGSGSDRLGGGFGADDLSGGPGRDIVFYGQRSRRVRVSIGKGANDGSAGERDNVRADVEDVRGGRGNDVLIGNGAANELFGGGGRDRLVGKGGSDVLMGGDGNDRLDARDGTSSAARAAAGPVDRIVCGGGEDTALVDPGDIVDPGCEHVQVVGGTPSPQNHAPTGLTLSPSPASVAEDQAVGAAVGTLAASDPDPGDTASFALVPGAGSTDNGSFRIVGSTLETNAVFDYETDKHTYSVRIRATDHGTPAGQIVRTFTISLKDVNEAPTGLTLSNDTLAEDQQPDTTVGNLSVSDVDAGQTHTFSLVSGNGSDDNGKFAITGSTLKTAQILDFETQQTYKIRVRATDSGTPPQSVDKEFTIKVTDVPEAPAPLGQSVHTDEDAAKTIQLSATDSEGDAVTEFVTSGASHGTLGTVSAPINCSGGTPNTCTADVVFTPDANYNGPAGFTYTAKDASGESAPATVSVTVDPVNDAPDAIDGSRSTDEDTPLTLNLAALVSDVETAPGNLTYTIESQPAHGTATATTYTPNADFNGTDTFTYSVTDRGDPDDCGAPGAGCVAAKTSATKTVTVTVNPVNDAPVALDGSRTTDEDTPVALNLDALASDVETGDANLTYTIETQPAHGTATGTTYTPNADFNGIDTFTYSVTDRGDPDNCGAPGPGCDAATTSATKTVTVTVDAVNDAPVNHVPAGPVTAVQDTDKALTGISVTDVDAASDDVKLTLTVSHGTLTVDTSVFGGVGMLQVAGSGTPTVVITAPLAQINTTLAASNGLVYHGDAPYTGPDTLTVASDDLGHNGSGGAKTDTATLGIVVSPPNAAPVAAPQSVSTNEDTPKTITLSASDADGDPLTFAIKDGTTHGVLGPIGSLTCTGATPNECSANVTYTADANFNGADSFTFTANDSKVTSAPATVDITVNPVNDAPNLANTEAGALSYTENDPATFVTGTTTVTDIDSANFDTGTLTVDYSVGGTADDRLEVSNNGPITVAGSTVSHSGTPIGTFTGGSGTTALVVTLNPSATAAATQDLVRAITYRNISDAPSSAARSVRFVLTDGDGGTSAPATRAINLIAVDDPPALAGIEAGALAYTENDPATAITSALTVTDPDSNITGATIAITSNFAAAEDVLGFVNQLGITGNYNAGTGVLTLSGSASPADYQTALRAVTYRNTSDNPSTATRTVSFTVPGATTATRDITVTAVNDAPVADDESFTATDSAVGNTALVGNDPTDGPPAQSGPKKTITADILAGDTDAEGQTLVVQTVTNQATNDGGRVTIEADGDFVYTPAPATSCTDHSDFFDYTVSDQNATGPGPTPGTDTGRVTIAIAGCVWYVNNNAAGNSGTSDAPFDTLAQAETASGNNDTVFVFDGDNTSTGYGGDGYAMNSGERLIGEHEGLVVGADTLQPANPGAKPTLTAANADVIDLASGNEVRGFVLDPNGTGGGIAGGSGDAGGTIDDVDVTDAGTPGTQAGLELNGTAGTFNVSNFTVNNQATGVLLNNNAGTVNFASAGTVSITSAGAKGLDAAGTNMGTSVFDSITSTGSNAGGVSMSNTTGSTTFGDLALTTTAGTTAAFGLVNAGTVSVPAAGTDNLSATGGPALDVQSTSGAALAFDDVDSTSSSGDGINIDGLGAGTFTAASGDITGAAGIGFDLNAGSGTITYAGNLNNGSGVTAVEITGRTGGAVTFSGAIADSNDAGGGISLSGNTGGSTTFSNASKVINSGAFKAISMTGSDGHTLTLSGGGLDVDTTSAVGIDASNSGTLAVSGTGNTIDTTGGTALNVVNTDFGGAGATFQHIASSGGSDTGIVLSATGTSGGLTVTGAGTAGSGGTIANKTGADGTTVNGIGVYMNDTGPVALNRMQLNDFQNFALRGTTVRGFTLADSTINGSNGTSTAADEASVAFDNLTGSAAITNDNISGGFEDDVRVQNTTGSLNSMSVTGSTFATANLNSSNDALALLGKNGATAFNATVQNNSFTRAQGDLYQYTVESGTGTMHFDSNTVTNNWSAQPTLPAGGGDINISAGSIQAVPTLTYSINNNNIYSAGTGGQPPNGSVIVTAATPQGSATGTIQNNVIGTTGVTQSGGFDSILANAVKAGVHKVTITGNTIRRYKEAGIRMLAVSPAASPGFNLRATVKGNTIVEPDSVAFAGIDAEVGGDPADIGTICLDLGGTAAADKNSVSGGDPSDINDINVIQQFATSMNLPGYGGAATDDTAVQNFLAARNDGNAPPLPKVFALHDTTTGDGNPAGSGFTGTGTDCS